ncbi:hypothetical protein IJJ05_02440 [Candidatus Saccharibacteria bacterium]|nr:hypothetical protein [Candidatus Saccharibacteria bacterium]
MLKNRIFAVMAVLLGGLFFSVINVSAVDEEINTRMTISPPQQKIVLVPGETFEGTIKVSNSGEAKNDLEYSVTIGSFGLGKDENGNVDYNDTDTDTITVYNQMMEWITLGKESGAVAPNTTDIVPFTINVPLDAPAGGQYATIIFQDDTENNESGGNVTIKSVLRFAASIFAEVAGETRDEGVITENNIPSFIFNNKLSAGSTVKNNGNVHTDASYILQVWPLFSDEEICTNEEEPNTSLIMPETSRYHVEECSLPAIGIFRAKQTVSIFGETSVTEKTVVVCPMWLLFLIIFAIALLIIWIIAKAKAGKKREA